MRVSRNPVVLISIVIVVSLCVTYVYRIRVMAALWHFRNGHTMTFESYIVPVPSNWYPKNVGNGNELLVRLKTESGGQQKDGNPPASILLLSGRKRNEEEIDRLFSQEQTLWGGANANKMSSRVFDISGETVTCIGGTRLESSGLYKVDPTVWRCKSTGGLEIRVIASDLDIPEAWDVVTHIKKSR
jgi:hypothetical protein